MGMQSWKHSATEPPCLIRWVCWRPCPVKSNIFKDRDSHNLSGKPVPVFNYHYSKKKFLISNRNFFSSSLCCTSEKSPIFCIILDKVVPDSGTISLETCKSTGYWGQEECTCVCVFRHTKHKRTKPGKWQGRVGKHLCLHSRLWTHTEKMYSR